VTAVTSAELSGVAGLNFSRRFTIRKEQPPSFGVRARTKMILQVDITFQQRSWRSEHTLPSPAHHFPGFERAAAGAIYHRAREGRGKFSGVLPRARRGWRMTILLQRPGDRAIGRAIRRSVGEAVAPRVQVARHCAFGRLPTKFFIQ
jgi:hypothetical protein